MSDPAKKQTKPMSKPMDPATRTLIASLLQQKATEATQTSWNCKSCTVQLPSKGTHCVNCLERILYGSNVKQQPKVYDDFGDY